MNDRMWLPGAARAVLGRLGLVAGVMAAWAGVAAPAAALEVYPIRQLIGYEGEETAAARRLVDPAFVAAVQHKGAAHFVEAYAASFRQHFGAVAAQGIDQRNRFRTFAASLHLTRASHYQVEGLDGTVTHFFPLTLSLNITNPLTGEVVYSLSRTRYEMAKLLASAGAEEVRAQQMALYERNLLTLIDAVVAEAAAGFKPTQIGAVLRREWHGLFILDKGMEAGIAAGDDLQDAAGNLIKVLHAGNGHAVAVPVLAGRLEPGGVFSKYATMGVQDLKKPRVLILPEARQGAQDATDDTVAELFAQLLARDTAFTLTPVNRQHQQVLNALDRETQLGQVAVKQNRALPAYFLRLRALPLNVYEVPTNSPRIKHRLYEALAFGELLDNAGAVVYAATARSRIDDEIINGTGFDMRARYEVMLKNVVLELAGKFGKGVRFRAVSAPVQRVEGEVVTVSDPGYALADGASVQVFRALDAGLGEPVQVPIWEARVQGREGASVRLALVLAQTQALQQGGIRPAVGDVVLVQEAGRASEKSVRFQPCEEEEQQLGGFKLAGYGRFAYYQFAEQTNLPFYSRWQELGASLEELTRNAGFRASLHIKAPQQLGYCVLPTTKIEVQERRCEAGLCSARVGANLVLGVREPGQSKVRYFGQKTEQQLTQVPEASFDDVVSSQLLEVAPVLLKESVRRIHAEPWGVGR